MGTNRQQDMLLSDKENKFAEEMEFSDCLNKPVDMSRIKLKSFKPWISKKITEILPMEDHAVIELIYNQLEAEKIPCPKKMLINMNGSLNGSSAQNFMEELWRLLLLAQESEAGIPEELLEKKNNEIIKAEAESTSNGKEEENFYSSIESQSNFDYNSYEEDSNNIKNLEPRSSDDQIDGTGISVEVLEQKNNEIYKSEQNIKQESIEEEGARTESIAKEQEEQLAHSTLNDIEEVPSNTSAKILGNYDCNSNDADNKNLKEMESTERDKSRSRSPRIDENEAQRQHYLERSANSTDRNSTAQKSYSSHRDKSSSSDSEVDDNKNPYKRSYDRFARTRNSPESQSNALREEQYKYNSKSYRRYSPEFRGRRSTSRYRRNRRQLSRFRTNTRNSRKSRSPLRSDSGKRDRSNSTQYSYKHRHTVAKNKRYSYAKGSSSRSHSRAILTPRSRFHSPSSTSSSARQRNDKRKQRSVSLSHSPEPRGKIRRYGYDRNYSNNSLERDRDGLQRGRRDNYRRGFVHNRFRSRSPERYNYRGGSRRSRSRQRYRSRTRSPAFLRRQKRLGRRFNRQRSTLPFRSNDSNNRERKDHWNYRSQSREHFENGNRDKITNNRNRFDKHEQISNERHSSREQSRSPVRNPFRENRSRDKITNNRNRFDKHEQIPNENRSSRKQSRSPVRNPFREYSSQRHPSSRAHTRDIKSYQDDGNYFSSLHKTITSPKRDLDIVDDQSEEISSPSTTKATNNKELYEEVKEKRKYCNSDDTSFQSYDKDSDEDIKYNQSKKPKDDSSNIDEQNLTKKKRKKSKKSSSKHNLGDNISKSESSKKHSSKRSKQHEKYKEAVYTSSSSDGNTSIDAHRNDNSFEDGEIASDTDSM